MNWEVFTGKYLFWLVLVTLLILCSRLMLSKTHTYASQSRTIDKTSFYHFSFEYPTIFRRIQALRRKTYSKREKVSELVPVNLERWFNSKADCSKVSELPD